MMPSKQNLDHTVIDSHPSDWDTEALKRNCSRFLASLKEENETSVPLKRLQYQMEENAVYQEILKRWDALNGSQRIDSWRRLLDIGEKVMGDVLPVCVQCGDCCREGSPTLQLEDLELLRHGRIPWHQLFTIRRGEPVHSPFEKELFFLLDERIKIREKAGTRDCVFFNGETNLCSIYVDRPIQCRAQACWDPEPARELAKLPYLTRSDIFEGIDLLLEMMGEHGRRCSFESFRQAFQHLEETKGESVDEVLEMLSYEDHFRHFLAEKLNIPDNLLDLVFGRSFSDLIVIFGFKIIEEPGGTRVLVPDRS
ncbi:MAG: YkgJ family cysteine cluster protein [Syntrophobacteraceae bacterium]|nr:YkgJ family cysteine cluster protein [Syntrophobacteraceae bacterium]